MSVDEVKCECGHTNPPGTALCESCGRPMGEAADSTGVLNMRYEGAARRSQTRRGTLLDKVWNFFSSVKVAVVLIVITLVASVIGTIFPQEMYLPVPPEQAEQYYREAYGTLGELYYQLGFHRLYESWWYVGLLLMIGASLVICSLDRVVPLYRALKNQRVKRHVDFLTRQRVAAQVPLEGRTADELLAAAEQAMAKRRYHVRREGLALLGEKGRFSRWGPYINHVGLIIFLVGVLLRLVPGFYMNEYVWVREGETKPILGTPYYVKNERFTVTYYDEHEFPQKIDLNGGKVVKEYRTDAVLYRRVDGDKPGASPQLEEVARAPIRVNHPLEHDGLLLYQAGSLTEFGRLTLELRHKQTGRSFGTFTVDLHDPAPSYRLRDGATVEILEYFPDFVLNENNEPSTKSNVPNNPAFVFRVKTPDKPEGEKSWLFLGLTIEEPNKTNTYELKFRDMSFVDVSGLMVRMDRSLPVIFFGCGVVMVGLVMGFYWQHRRIWVQVENGVVYLAAHTNKNWFGLKKDVLAVAREAGLAVEAGSLDQGGKRT